MDFLPAAAIACSIACIIYLLPSPVIRKTEQPLVSQRHIFGIHIAQRHIEAQVIEISDQCHRCAALHMRTLTLVDDEHIPIHWRSHLQPAGLHTV